MIKTERLLIRRVRIDDWKALQAVWIDEAQSECAQYDRMGELDDRSVFCRIQRWASCSRSEEHLFYAVCLDDEVIGYTVFHRRETGYEIGYCFRSDCQGKGYAKESISALLERMKAQGAARIMAGTALKNTRSVRLLASLGFVLTGTEEVSFRKDPERKDICFEGGIFELTL